MLCRKILTLLLLAGSAFAGPWLGVTFKRVEFESHMALDVKGVHPGSGCFSAGIVSGDKIIGVAGKPLIEMSQLTSLIAGGKVGQTISIEILHENKKLTKKVKLTDRPDDISELTGSAIGSKIASFGKNFYKNGELRKEKPKATLLDFWATWCGPCRKTLPILEEMYQKLGNQGLEIIGVSDEALETLTSFYDRQHKSPYPLYRDADKSLWRRYGITAVPTLMLLDGEGYIKGVWSGVPDKKSLERFVQETMNGN